MRCIFESDDVSAVKDAQESKNSRIADAWRGLTWSLSIEPEPKDSQQLEANVKNCRIYTQAPEPLANVPPITVVYTYDADKIEIKAVMFNEAATAISAVQKKSAK